MRSESTVDYNIGAVMRRRNDGAGAAMRPGASGDSAVVGNVHNLYCNQAHGAHCRLYSYTNHSAGVRHHIVNRSVD